MYLVVFSVLVVRQKRERDAAVFSELHRKLQGQTMLKNRWAILYLLMKLSEDKNRPKVSLMHIRSETYW